jgi:hypothetical protein
MNRNLRAALFFFLVSLFFLRLPRKKLLDIMKELTFIQALQFLLELRRCI